MNPYNLKEVLIDSNEPDEAPGLLDRCTIEVSREGAYCIIAFQVLFFLGLVIFIIVFGIKLLG